MERLRDLFDGAALPVAHHKGGSLGRRKCLERGDNLLSQFSAQGQAVWRGTCGGALFDGPRRIGIVLGRTRAMPLLGASFPPAVERAIHRDSIDPGPKICARLKLRKLAIGDRKSTRLNSSHGYISYAVFCLKKKKKQERRMYRR